MIIVSGFKVFPNEVEAVLATHPGVIEAGCVGMPDERLGEVPVAVIYPHEDSSLTEEELRSFLEPRISAYKIPVRFISADEPLPKLGTGKIDRVAIKAQYRS